ncbi:hypothetical protein FQN57_001437 [Myotisia sp. PD_48]|nr:hypothetical protein FQN57_001437 [Myotisia sp. PD_48]
MRTALTCGRFGLTQPIAARIFGGRSLFLESTLSSHFNPTVSFPSSPSRSLSPVFPLPRCRSVSQLSHQRLQSRPWKPKPKPRSRSRSNNCFGKYFRSSKDHESSDFFSSKYRFILVSAAGAAGLGSSVFLEVAERGGNGTTNRELDMLEVSRNEAYNIRNNRHGHEEDDLEGPDGRDRNLARSLRGFAWHAYTLFDDYVIEVIATGFRFLHLVAIFIPVMATVPVIWFGQRENGRERRGTLWWYTFLVSAMERAGPTFIKLGQWAATRTDIFPPQLCSLMSSLHSHAPAHPLHITKETISRAFNGLPFEDIFIEFEEKPLGVGAIAQVYKAKLRPDLAVPESLDLVSQPANLREKMRKNVDVLVKNVPQRVPSSYVAIKVLHPYVERTVRRDLRIMAFFAAIINFIPTMEWLSFPDEVEKFGQMMQLQMDMRIEAANLSMFRTNFKSRTTAWFPYPYTEYTTREVLVEEYAQGIPLAAFLENGGGAFQREIAHEGLDAFLHMLIIDNFIHSDLHPGNIMVRFYKAGQLDLSLRTGSPPPAATWSGQDETETVLARLRKHRKDRNAWNETLNEIDAEGYRPQLIFIDTGLVTELNAVNRRDFLDLFRAIAEFDGYKAGHLMVERSRQPESVIDAEIFALRMQHLILSIKGRTFALGNVKIGDILTYALSLVRTHHVRLEGDFVNVVISALLLEGIGRSLDPDLDIFKNALPILRQLGSGTTLIKSMREGDTSMLRVWLQLEARSLLQTSVSNVERCVKYDLLSPNI